MIFPLTDMVMLADSSESWTVLQLFEKGGWLMWVLLVLSIIMVMVAFVCLWTTRESAVLPQRMVMSVDSYIRRKDYAGLISLCEKDDSSFSRTVHVIVLFLQRNRRAESPRPPAVSENTVIVGGGNVAIDAARAAVRLGAKNVTVVYRRTREDMPAAAEEVAEAEASRQANILTRQISWLSDIGAIAPMIGLLGTVWGMMKTFKELADGNFEGAKNMGMANGIYEAMITTAGGLVLAIPSMLAYVFFRSRIQKHITNMEVAVTHVLSSLSVVKYREQHPGRVAMRGMVNEQIVDDDE